MKRLIITIMLSPLFATAQIKGSSEFTSWLGTHAYNHKGDVYSSFGQPVIDVKNTIGNSLLIDFRRITKRNLLFYGGIEIGYEHFSGDINYPFEKFGYSRPGSMGKQYTLNATTLYGRINLGLGYRLKIKDNFYDLLIGNMMQTPITHKQDYHANLEILAFGGDNYNFHKQAYFGKDYDADFVVDNISFIHLSTVIKSLRMDKSALNIGLRAQRSLFFPYGSLNAFLIEYMDDKGKIVGRDSYYDNQFAISLLLGYTF